MASSKKRSTAGTKRAGGTPPAAYQFRPGQSGNPRGRPKRSRNLTKLIDAELDQLVELSENGRPVKLSKREVLAKRLVNDAIQGDKKSQAILLSRMGSGEEEQGEPMSEMDAAEIARFVARFLPKPGEEPQ